MARNIGAAELNHLFDMNEALIRSESGFGLNDDHTATDTPFNREMLQSVHSGERSWMTVDDDTLDDGHNRPLMYDEEGNVVAFGKRPGCWAQMWHRIGMHFLNEEVEQKFLLQRLRSDEYYKLTKWVLIMLAILYVRACDGTVVVVLLVDDDDDARSRCSSG